MSEIVVRFAEPQEGPRIVAFLQEHWDPEFAVVKSKELFDFLYQAADRVNFVLALDGDKLVATLGVTLYGEERSDCSPSAPMAQIQG
jgi:hypothetical protein